MKLLATCLKSLLKSGKLCLIVLSLHLEYLFYFRSVIQFYAKSSLLLAEKQLGIEKKLGKHLLLL